jgi:hypothetical protein
MAQALTDLAFHAVDGKDFARAKAFLDEASSLTEKLGQPRMLAHIKHVRGVMAASEGDFEGGLALDEESLALYRRLGDTWQGIIIAWNVGVNSAALQRFEAARRHLTECLQGGLELAIRWSMAYPLEAFACLAIAERKFELGARLYGASDAQRANFGLVRQTADHPALKAILERAGTEFAGAKIDAARQEGRRLTLDEAITLALGDS